MVMTAMPMMKKVMVMMVSVREETTMCGKTKTSGLEEVVVVVIAQLLKLNLVFGSCCWCRGSRRSL
jgi:hypothetical protein